MKSYSIVLLIVLSLTSLSLLVWVAKPKTQSTPIIAPEPSASDELQVPKHGPYGKVEVEEEEFNFGVKNVGEKGVHSFKLKNVGEGPLDFRMGKPSCQCTLGEITKENGEEREPGPIAPGDAISILVKWDMKYITEKFRQHVPVNTTDPDRKKVEFAIAGSVTSMFLFSPDTLGNASVGDIQGTDPAFYDAYCYSKTLDEFKLEITRPEGQNKMKVTVEPAAETWLQERNVKSGYHIHVEVPGDIPVGRFRESFQVHASCDEGERDGEITIFANRPGPIEIRGVVGAAYNSDSDRILFRDFPAAEGAKATMTLFAKHFDGDLQLMSFESSDPSVSAKMDDKPIILGKTKAYKITIEIAPAAHVIHRGPLAATISLKLNHPEVPVMDLLIDYRSIR